MSYHQTTPLTGMQLKQAVISATKLEAAVFLIYKETRKKWTPWDIYGMLTRAGKRYPITSVRRGITDLMNKGELVKTGDTKLGEYDRPECYWQINPSKHPAPVNVKQSSLFG